MRRSYPLGQTFLIHVGESVDITGESLTVTYSRLVQDSRCPPDVQCIWAGYATITVTVAKEGSPAASVDLNTAEGPTSGQQAGYTVELVELDVGQSPTASLKVT